MRNFNFSIAAFIILLCFASCDKDRAGNDYIAYTTAQVTDVAGPNTALLNQEIDLEVFYYLNNGCGRFERLIATTSGNTTNISLNARYEGGSTCTTVIIEGQVTYKFKATQAGLHFFKFLQPNQTYRTDTIIVN